MLLLSGSSHNTNHAKSELGIYTTDQTGAFEITFSLMGIPFSVPSDSSPCEDTGVVRVESTVRILSSERGETGGNIAVQS